MVKIEILLLTLFASLQLCCNDKSYLKKIDSYLNAATIQGKSQYLAENYHHFFLNKVGEGKNKGEALKSFMQWDGPMHPDIRINSYTVNDSVWTVKFLEQNDFTKLIGFPGWKGTMTFTFDSKGFIAETYYVPDGDNPPYKPYLSPALEWLRKNKPQELNEVYQDNRLIQTEITANKWRELLKQWKNETGR